jgi:indolepyruvate ferredoxin oxidoreductase beta subunit
MTPTPMPTSILIAALGGEGGGVLAEWIVDAALRAGLPVQATSVPGVAQRTGATSYYVEFLDVPVPDGRQPVFALMPLPGRVDVVLASELLEGVRMAERGFVSPQQTLLITASHRVLTTTEKMAMGDGRFDSQRLLAAASASAQRCLALDLLAIAQRHRTAISAVMYGALAGSGRLPWSRDIDEAVIRARGVGVETSLTGYAEAFDAARDGLSATAPSALPPALADIVQRGEARLRDYQDDGYAARYRVRVDSLRAVCDPASPALEEAARQLALWMSYEDVIRVADLKTRRERFERVRAEAMAGPRDVLEIREHLSPGLEEIAAIAPRRLGLALRRRVGHAHGDAYAVGARGKGMTLATTSVHGFVLLRLLASLRRWRPHSLRFHEEQAAIDTWLAALRDALPRHTGFAAAIAELPRLRKGYSDTFDRGRSSYERIFDALVVKSGPPDEAAAEALREAITAALAEPEVAAPPPRPHGAAQPIVWRARDSTLTIDATRES